MLNRLTRDERRAVVADLAAAKGNRAGFDNDVMTHNTPAFFMAWMRSLYGRCVVTLTAIIGSTLAIAADPGVGEWTTFGNGAGHTGYYPRQIGAGQFTAGWTKTFTTGVNQVAVSGDAVYATTSGSFTAGMQAFALKVADGTEKWSFALGDAYSVNPPTYANGRVYFQRCDHGNDTHLWSLDASSGALRFAAPHGAQWASYEAPTVAGGGAFVNGGTNGGMYGFDATTGAQRFFVGNILQQDGWTPSYAGGVVYACVNANFTAYDPQTGSQLWTRNLNTTSTGYSSWQGGNIPAISDGKAAVVGGGRIVVIDLATRTQLWTQPGFYHGTPAIAEGRVYAFVEDRVIAYDAASGTQLGEYVVPGAAKPIHQPLVTKDLLLYSSGTGTFVFDRDSYTLRQTLEAGGKLSYASGRLYVVSEAWSTAPSTLATFTVTPEELDPPVESLPPAELPQARPNPARSLGTTTVAWLDTVQSGGIAYFLFNSPAKIERYEMATGAWLEPISLPPGPTGFTVSATSIYVSFGQSVSKFALDGSTETPLGLTHISIKTLFELNDRLYLVSPAGANFLSIDPSTGLVLGSKNYNYNLYGISLAGSKRKFLARSSGTPGDIMSVSLNEDGSFGEQKDSPYDGTYPSASRTYLFPGEARVVDNEGIIYATSDLSYLGNFAGAFIDIAFGSDKTVLLRSNNTLVVYSAGLAEIGRKTIAGGQTRIYIQGEDVYSFARQDGRGVVATKTPMADIVVEEPPPGLDPTTLTYTPDAIEFGGDTVFLLSRLHQSVFRWSISQQKYLESISLTEVPLRIAYSPAHNRLYLGYSTSRIGKVELADGVLTESAFVNLTPPPVAMLAAGDFMFFAESTNHPGPQVFTYKADGTLAASKDVYSVQAPIWSEALRRVFFTSVTSNYHFRSLEIDTEGQFGMLSAGPYLGQTMIQGPFRVSPDGSRAVFANAAVHNAADFSRVGSLAVVTPPPNSTYPSPKLPSVIDSAWLNGTLHTVRANYAFGSMTAAGATIEAWNSDLTPTGGSLVQGTPLRLNALSDGLLVVSMYEGYPIFTRFNAALEQVSIKPGNDIPPAGPITRTNPARELRQTSSQWLEAAKHGGIAYFLFATPAKLERYDIAASSWLEPISLPDGPTALAIGASGIYVSFGKGISRFSFDGTSETILLSAAVNLRPIAEFNGRLYFAAASQTWGSARFGAADITTGGIIAEATFSYPTTGNSFSPLRRKFFGRSLNSSDIIQLSLTAAGTFGVQSDSPTHGNPHATRTFLFPGEARVVDDSGIMYSTTDLTYVGSLAGAFNDIDFNADAPVVLRGKTLVTYSAALLETGRRTLASEQQRIYVGGGFVHAFAREDGRGIVVTRTALADIVPPEPPQGIDPTLFAYTPDEIEFGGDTVFLLSKSHRSVFRWSISGRRYLETIALTEVPQRIAYSAAHNRLYLSYSTGRIGKVDLAAGLIETGFVNLSSAPEAMLAAGNFMFFGTPFGVLSASMFTYAADGTLVGTRTDSSTLYSSVWNGTLGRVLYATGSSASHFSSVQIGEDGKFGQVRNGAYPSSDSIEAPLWVAPDGSRTVFGNAAVHNAGDHSRVGELPIPAAPPVTSYPYTPRPRVVGSAWIGGVLHTLRNVFQLGSSTPSSGLLEAWKSDLTLKDSVSAGGAPLRLQAVAEGVLMISLVDSRPVFTLFSAALEQLSSGPIDNPAPSGPVVRNNPQRALEPTEEEWIDAAKFGGIAYFLFDSPAKIERHELQSGVWLAPIPLPDGPTSFALGQGGIYVSFGRSVSQFSFDGTTETVLFSAAIDVRPLAEHGGRLYVSGTELTSRFGAVDLATGVLHHEAIFSYGPRGVAFAPASGKFFGRTTGVYPEDIVQIRLNPNGTFGTQTDSPYHGGYPSAARTFVSPGETRVVDDAGFIYSTSDLRHLGSLGGALVDLDFIGEQPLVFRSNELVVYSATLEEAGRRYVGAGVLRIFAANNLVAAFSRSTGRGVSAARIPIESGSQPFPFDLKRLKGTFFASFASGLSEDVPESGMLKLTVGAEGSASGVLKIGGKKYRFRTRFDAAGHASVSLVMERMEWTLELDLSEGLNFAILQGSLVSDHWELSLSGSRARASTEPDRQLFVITDSSSYIREDAPPVAGHGVMTISRHGNVRIDASLLIGGAVTQGTMLLEDGSVVLNLATKAKDSFVDGRIAAVNANRSTWSGLLQWEKRAKKRSARYRWRISSPVIFSGSRYKKPDSPLVLPPGRGVTMILDFGDLRTPIALTAKLHADGRISSVLTGASSLARLNVKTGFVRGSFVHPVTRKNVRFNGVVNRSFNQVLGSFLGPKNGGVFRIVPHE